MANHVSHASLPYVIKGAKYTLAIPYLDADGDPIDPTSPDTEISKDGGAFTDCTEEVTVIPTGCAYITLTGLETDCSLLLVAAKSSSGPKTTLLNTNPRILPVLESGTAQAGTLADITLATNAAAYELMGCIIKTTGGTGGGGANNQARMVSAYNNSSKVASVTPDWEVRPSGDTTYQLLLTDLAVNSVKSNTSSWRNIAVPADSGSGIPRVDVQQWVGGTIPTPNIVGVPKTDVNYSLGTLIIHEDFTLTEATSSRISLPATDSAGSAIPDKKQYRNCVLNIVNGAGKGQMVLITTPGTGIRQYNIVNDTAPTPLDNTSKCIVEGTWDTVGETLLKHDWSNISGEAARSAVNALRHIRNRWNISGLTKTVYKEDDSTSAWTSSVTTNDDASPIIGDDPA